MTIRRNNKSSDTFYFHVMAAMSLLFIMALITYFLYTIGNIVDAEMQSHSQSMNIHNAKEIEKELQIPYNYTKGITDILSHLDRVPLEVRRLFIFKVIETISMNNPQWLSVWAVFEPNEIDGLDNSYKNDGVFGNEIGRFNLGFYRTKDGGLKFRQFTENDALLPYYQIPKKNLKAMIMNPEQYSYEENETTLLTTTIEIPILRGNRFIGLVGIDFDMQYYTDMLKERLGLMSENMLVFVSNNGTIVSHADNTKIGKHITDIDILQTCPRIHDNIINGNAFNISISDNDRDYSIAFTPVRIGDIVTMPWSIGIIHQYDLKLSFIKEISTNLFYVCFIVSIGVLIYFIRSIHRIYGNLK